MSSESSKNLSLIRDYLCALEVFATGPDLAKFFMPDAVQVELPNRLNPRGATSDLATLLKRAELAPTILSSQRYEVLSEVASESRVAIEATWQGELAVPFGELSAGSRLKAHFAMFFEVENGCIRTQRNYDCFEPW